MDDSDQVQSSTVVYHVLVSDLPHQRLTGVMAKHAGVRIIFAGRYDVVTGAEGTRHEVAAHEIGISLVDPIIESL
ncbi:hypothetical protein [Agromyces laixinhei]|uniref:hypothetical protein n=1 Tax=Agromyces laixinhei TaxID=2585717 RepID=UPI001117265A|nr:hypothetical protein [Agromyces laixinhei]